MSLIIKEDGTYSVKIYTYTESNGDGSYTTRNYPTMEERNAYGEAYEASDYYEGCCDAYSSVTFTFDEDGLALDGFDEAWED